MSFSEKLQELSALGAEIAQQRHRIGTLKIQKGGADYWQDHSLQRDILRAELDLTLAETRRDTLRLEMLWAISDRALLDFSDLEDVAP